MSDLLTKLNGMKKPELISLARRLNDDVKIVNVHRLKKQDLLTELVVRQDLVLKLLEGAAELQKKALNPKTKGKEKAQLIKKAAALMARVTG